MPCDIYLDSSVLCALADPPARAALPRALQLITRRWWHRLPHIRNACTSEFTLARIRSGPPHLASARLTLAESLHILPETAGMKRKTELFLAGGGLSTRAGEIGYEIAYAAAYDASLFVTWDWKRIEAARLPALRIMMQEAGLSSIEFLTPLQLLEVSYETL